MSFNFEADTLPVVFEGNVRQGALGASVPAGTANIEADPLFVGAPGDLHVQAASPAIGNAVPGVVTTDYSGVTRVRNTAGAYD